MCCLGQNRAIPATTSHSQPNRDLKIDWAYVSVCVRICVCHFVCMRVCLCVYMQSNCDLRIDWAVLCQSTAQLLFVFRFFFPGELLFCLLERRWESKDCLIEVISDDIFRKSTADLLISPLAQLDCTALHREDYILIKMEGKWRIPLRCGMELLLFWSEKCKSQENRSLLKAVLRVLRKHS